MCCDTMMWSAQSETLISLLPRPASRRGTVSTTPRRGRNRRHDVSRGCVPEVRAPSDEAVNPVRWCARRRLVGIAGAWAAPLFSDDAPREVHLWQ
jgi:hypothetical protein